MYAEVLTGKTYVDYCAAPNRDSKGSGYTFSFD